MEIDISSKENLINLEHSTDDILVNIGDDDNDKTNLLRTKKNIPNEIKFFDIYHDFLTFSFLPVISIVPSIITGSSPMLIYSFLGKIMNIITQWNKDQTEDPLNNIIQTCLIISILVLISSIATFFQSFLWTQIGYLFSNKLKRNLFQNLMLSDVTFYDSNSIGNFITLFSDDGENIQNSFGQKKGRQIFNLGQFLIGTLLCFFYTWKLPFISFIFFIPIAFFISKYYSKKIDIHNNLKFLYLSKSTTIAEETISSIKTVRSFNNELKETQRYLKELDELRNEEKTICNLDAYCFFSQLFLLWILIFINFYYGGMQILTNKIETGYMLTIFGILYHGGFGMIYFLNSLPEEQKAISSYQRIVNMANQCYSYEQNENNKIQINDFSGKIEFVDVSFKYPTRDIYVLKHISFTIYPGQMCAFVGHSGSGKSTIIQLIEGFYFCQEGVILIDDVDIRDIDLNWLHQKIGLVSQDISLFKMSIRDNIEYGLHQRKTSIDIEKINDAIKIANLEKFVSKYSLDYNVGDKGNKISGGQKQRISIARAVIKDPVILITDEATSALDSNNERKVQDAFSKVMKNRTSILVSHRLSTIKNADCIYVIDNNEIKEKGKHEFLINMKGIYYELIKKQI